MSRAERAASAAIEAHPLPAWSDLDERTRIAVARRVRAERSPLTPEQFYERARERQVERQQADTAARELARQIRSGR